MNTDRGGDSPVIFNQSQSSLTTLMPLLWQVSSHDQPCLFVGLFESFLSGEPDSDLLSYRRRSQLSGEESVVWGGASVHLQTRTVLTVGSLWKK